MNIIQAVILGIIQGLGEFLPISSSGHLVLVQKLFGVNEGALSFDIIVHLGTLISLMIVMRRRLAVYLREPFGHVPRMVALGTIPTVVIAFAFRGFFKDLFDTGVSLGVGFLYTALILYIAENHKDAGAGASAGKRKAARVSVGKSTAMPPDGRNVDDRQITPIGALIVGISQGIAVIPAVSRSGSTISSGIVCNFGKPAAVEFAFLMSIPVTLLAVAQDLLSMILSKAGTAAAVAGDAGATAAAAASGAVAASAAGAVEMTAGFVAAAVTGFFAARFMLSLINRIKLTWFSLYVGILGILIIIDQLFFGLVFDKLF